METEPGGTRDAEGQTVSTQLAALVPTFDPATDSVEVWGSKVALLLEAWPASRLTELATRLILNCKGTAFQKLQLKQKEFLKNERASIQKIVEEVGGTWGQVPLEQHYDLVEKALFRCQQKADETGDSFVSRVDVVWSELLTKKFDLTQIQTYVLLRGSRLSPEDKKRVLVEAGAEGQGAKLEWKRVVGAIRMLSSSFFQDYTGSKKDKTLKTYDHTAFTVDDVSEGEAVETFMTEELLDDDVVAYYAQEQDEDAALIMQFEEAIIDSIQDDPDLAAFFSTYQDARRRLTERVKTRGFWPIRKGSKGKGKGKSKGFKGGGKRTLAQKIANSYCRICWQKGHWKDECPQRPAASTTASTASDTNATIPTSFVFAEEIPPVMEAIPLMENQDPGKENMPDQTCLVTLQTDDWGNRPTTNQKFIKTIRPMIGRLRNKLNLTARVDMHQNVKLPSASIHPASNCSDCQDPTKPGDSKEWSQISPEIFNNIALFASEGTVGVVDLGASQTVMGSAQVEDLLRQLPNDIRSQVRRTPCQLNFRFGNHQTLASQQALMLPLQGKWFRIAIVPGNTPFLLSSSFLKQIGAVIDTEDDTLWSKRLNRFLPVERSIKNLYLLDINQLWQPVTLTDTLITMPSEDTSSKEIQKVPAVSSQTAQSPQADHQMSHIITNKHEVTGSNKVMIQQIAHATAHPLNVPSDTDFDPKIDSSVPTSSIDVSNHGQPVRPTASLSEGHASEQSDSRHGSDQQPHAERAGRREDLLRGKHEGQDICPGLRGLQMDVLHSEPFREQQEGRTSHVSSICGAQDEAKPQDIQGQPCCTGQDDGGSIQRREVGCWNRSLGGSGQCGSPDNQYGAGGSPDPPSGESKSLTSNGHHGDDHAGDLAAFAEPECEAGNMRVLSTSQAQGISNQIWFEKVCNQPQLDLDFEFFADVGHQSFHSKCKRLIVQLEDELRIATNHVRDDRITAPRLDLLEVMCSEQSELVKQAQHTGHRAQRFGLTEGDLSTKAGRQKLFQLMVRHRPKNVWYSPVCGPWGSWSHLNMGKSLQGYHDVMQKRASNLWQVSLAVVLYRWQRSQKKHFHMEQPKGSEMYLQPVLQEIFADTLTCHFDMCRVGALTDPQTGLSIRKRLQVQTTSESLHRAIHGQLCQQNHQHRQIAGSTRVHNQSIPLSTFTERYPSRFAKHVNKAILYASHESPTFVTTRKRNETDDKHPSKHRRLTEKLSPAEIARRFEQVSWQTVMQAADKVAPRVGSQSHNDGPLVEQVQQLCPEHTIHHIILCRGTDRYQGPQREMVPGVAPLRRRICIRRTTGDIVVDPEWEIWERLPHVKLRKKGVPARLSMSVFAVQIPKESSTHSESATAAPSAGRRELTDGEDNAPSAKRFCPDTRPEAKTPDSPELSSPESHQRGSQVEQELTQRQSIDLVSQKHGPKFLQLSTDTQAWLLKLHRNLGHPGSQKLAEFCRQLGCTPDIIAAIPELKCSTCLETSSPTIARPSAIHPENDFGDVIAMDGVTWTNQNGTDFYIYHIIDQSTSFHTAVLATTHSSDQAIKALTRGWLHWAGPPGMICIDAGTELTSEAFMQFLQKHGIKSKTIATDARWQNSRCERHGHILKQILTKMDKEDAISTPEQLEIAIAMATQTKNQWSRHRGYAPEVLVFGKNHRIPGSVISDENMASHSSALSDNAEGIRFRSELGRREQARRAFAQVDNCQTMRRAILQRSRPHRGQFGPGDWVMLWRRRGEADGMWTGPARVIIQEGNQVIWITMGNKLYRAAPEMVRSLSAVEQWKLPMSHKDSNSTANSIIPPHGGTQYHDVTNQVLPENLNPESIPEMIPAAPISVPPSDTSEQPDTEPPPVPNPPDESNPNNPTEHNPELIEPVNIPIPDDDDSELTCDCFHLQDEHCWTFSVDVSAQDIAAWKREENPHQMSFLVSAAKRQRSEVKMTQLNTEDKQRFEAAKAKEVESWITTGTIAKILRNKLPVENIMRCRWILTWKEVDTAGQEDQNPKHKPKARLVVLGYEDPQVDSIPRDSPTMSKLARMLVLQYAASKRWNIQSFDVQTAFLRGSEQSSRVLGMEPPEEMRQRLKLKPQEVVQLLKGAYGRVDAPYLWFMELKSGLETLGFQQCPFDPCLFTLTHPVTKQTEGLIGVHVDDGLCCGSTYFQQKLNELETRFPFGSKKSRDFTFTGLKIHQKENYAIEVDQTQYVKDIHAIAITRERRAQTTSLVTESERQQLRAVIGSLQYAAVNTRPDLCSRLGWLQSRINQATVDTLISANRILHEAKQHADFGITVQPIDLTDVRFVAFSDASFASEKCPDSHQGMLIAAAHKSIGENQKSSISPLLWHSRKIQKVAVSTLSAEAMALAGAVDVLSWVRLVWAWLIDTKCNWRQADKLLPTLPPAFSAIPPEPEEEDTTFPHHAQTYLKEISKSQQAMLTTDCKSLYDLVSRTAPPACSEFRTLLQAKLIKEHLQNGVQIRWVPSAAQLADALTKVMDSTILRTCLSQGKYSLHDESEILRTRSDRRTRLQWFKQHAETPCKTSG